MTNTAVFERLATAMVAEGIPFKQKHGEFFSPSTFSYDEGEQAARRMAETAENFPLLDLSMFGNDQAGQLRSARELYDNPALRLMRTLFGCSHRIRAEHRFEDAHFACVIGRKVIPRQELKTASSLVVGYVSHDIEIPGVLYCSQGHVFGNGFCLPDVSVPRHLEGLDAVIEGIAGVLNGRKVNRAKLNDLHDWIPEEKAYLLEMAKECMRQNPRLLSRSYRLKKQIDEMNRLKRKQNKFPSVLTLDQFTKFYAVQVAQLYRTYQTITDN